MGTTAILSAFAAMERRGAMTQYLDEKVQDRRDREEKAESIENANAAVVAPVVTVVEKPAEPEISREEQLAQARAKKAADAAAKRMEEEKRDAEVVTDVSGEREPTVIVATDEHSDIADAPKVAGEPSVTSPVAPHTITSDVDIDTKTPDSADDISDRIVVNQKMRAKADRKVRKKAKTNKHKRDMSRMRKKYKAQPNAYYESDSDSDSSDGEYLSDGADEESMAEQLRNFRETCKQGQLFFRHAGSRRRSKPQDRVIKVSFNAQREPAEISWGRGSRNIKFADILYIAAGFWTPTFAQPQRKEKLKESHCFSVVSNNGVNLNLEAHTEHTALLWIRGLRKLKKHSDEYSDRSARDNYKNLMSSKETRPTTKKDVMPIVRLQQDLFVMSLHTVMRHLEEERIWVLSPEVHQKFTPQNLYPTVLKQDIPWRQWQAWIREQVTAYCRENGLVNTYTQEPVNMQSVQAVQPPQQKLRRQSVEMNNNSNNNSSSKPSSEDQCSLM